MTVWAKSIYTLYYQDELGTDTTINHLNGVPANEVTNELTTFGRCSEVHHENQNILVSLLATTDAKSLSQHTRNNTLMVVAFASFVLLWQD